MRAAYFCILAFAAAASAQQAPKELVRIGGISAENGEFAFRTARITAYANGNTCVLIGSSDVCAKVRAGVASFDVSGSSLRPLAKDIPSAYARSFSLCDSFNQISRKDDSALSAVLPKDAKIKSIETLLNDALFVVYSEPGELKPRIEVSLIRAGPKPYVLLRTLAVSENGQFCGTEALAPNVRAILVDEPSGSSDFSVVYIYRLK